MTCSAALSLADEGSAACALRPICIGNGSTSAALGLVSVQTYHTFLSTVRAAGLPSVNWFLSEAEAFACARLTRLHVHSVRRGRLSSTLQTGVSKLGDMDRDAYLSPLHDRTRAAS